MIKIARSIYENKDIGDVTPQVGGENEVKAHNALIL